MGSITLTKAKGIWQTLPAPLRGAATLLAVLALAALPFRLGLVLAIVLGLLAGAAVAREARE